MHVDGFRFDLAAALGRGDERLRPARLVPRGDRPGPGARRGEADRRAVGHRRAATTLGQFPAGWSEWNGRFRDTVRDFWRGDGGHARRISRRASAARRDLFGHGGRRPTASVNIVTVHDGFTLADLVSYNAKHNEANGEDNRDGTDDNRSWNCGVEGPTDDAAVLALRGSAAAQLHRHAAALRGRAAAARRRRVRAHASTATTTPTARTTS